MKSDRFTILGVNHVDTSGNKVYACSCSTCDSKTWLGKPVFLSTKQGIDRLMCWCDNRFHFTAIQRELLVKRSLSESEYKLNMAPSKKEEWHRNSQMVLLCPKGHETFNRVGDVMFGKMSCDVCAGISKGKPKHLAIQFAKDYEIKHNCLVRQVSGWAGESTQYQVTCKQHGNFPLSLRRMKSDSICPHCATYKKSPEGLC